MDKVNQILADIIATAVATAVICLIETGISLISAKCRTEKARLALKELQTVLEDGVRYVEQTFVKAAKENGTWDAETQKVALDRCTDYIIGNLTERTSNLLAEGKDDITQWVQAKIESYIQSCK